MRIAVISDTHLGYARFEEDAQAQAAAAIADATKKADLILIAGDIFDTKIPKLETIARAIGMLRIAGAAGIPVIAIHGNHERRTKDLLNPAQLLDATGVLTYIHGTAKIIEKNASGTVSEVVSNTASGASGGGIVSKRDIESGGSNSSIVSERASERGGSNGSVVTDRVQVFGIGSVPEEYAKTALETALKSYAPEPNAFHILMLHQTIREFLPNGDEELSLENLEHLPFDLIINGHHHAKATKLGGKFIIPGSTVITQLKKEETEPKGYVLYDTHERKSEFVPIASRPFFYEELVFKDATSQQIHDAIAETVNRTRNSHPGSILALKIDGTLKEGLQSTDIRLPSYENVFMDNRLNLDTLSGKLERIRFLREEKLSVRDLALKELIKKTEGKVKSFDPAEIFDKLVTGPEETLEYLRKR